MVHYVRMLKQTNLWVQKFGHVIKFDPLKDYGARFNSWPC